MGQGLQSNYLEDGEKFQCQFVISLCLMFNWSHSQQWIDYCIPLTIKCIVSFSFLFGFWWRIESLTWPCDVRGSELSHSSFSSFSHSAELTWCWKCSFCTTPWGLHVPLSQLASIVSFISLSSSPKPCVQNFSPGSI